MVETQDSQGAFCVEAICGIVTRMNVQTNNIRAYGSCDGIRYAQEIGTLNGQLVALPIILSDDGNPSYQPPVELAQLVLCSINHWALN